MSQFEVEGDASFACACVRTCACLRTCAYVCMLAYVYMRTYGTFHNPRNKTQELIFARGPART